MRRGGVVGAWAAGRAGSGVSASGDGGSVGESAVSRYDAVSGVGEPNNSPHMSPLSAGLSDGGGRSGFAKLKVLEYLGELQRRGGYIRQGDAYSAMYATLAAFDDEEAVRDSDAFLRKVAEELPEHIHAEDAVRGVFAVLIPRISNGEIDDFTVKLPDELMELGVSRGLIKVKNGRGDV